MTLIIAFLLLKQSDAHWALYVLVVFCWIAHVIMRAACIVDEGKLAKKLAAEIANIYTTAKDKS